MKTLILAALLISSSAFAATVRITSFTHIRIAQDLNHPLAELCGKVDGAEKTPTFIRVSVDPGSRNPGTYNTLADDKGNFCVALMTYRGTAEVSIMGTNQTFKAQIQ